MKIYARTDNTDVTEQILSGISPGGYISMVNCTMLYASYAGVFNDFVAAVEAVTLDVVNQVAFIEFQIVDDSVVEATENFQVFLSTLSPGCAIQDGASPIKVDVIDDEIGGGGDDPHFSVVLPSGKLLCYTVQGEHGFSFNLISNKRMTMNARFVPDSRRSEVTWMGSMGIIVRDNMYKQANATALRFEAKENKIYNRDEVELTAKNIDKIVLKNGKLTISEAPPSEGFKYPSIYVDLQDVEITVGTGLGTGIELLYLAIFITLHTIYIIVITCVSCDLEILFYEV